VAGESKLVIAVEFCNLRAELSALPPLCQDNNYSPGAGKPLWLTADDASIHPIFFDDNIHNSAEDSIVAVRARQSAGGGYQPLSGRETIALQGLVLKRTPTFAAILDE
jgi:hypothetical protein